MPVKDIMDGREGGRAERDVRRLPGSTYEVGGDVPDEAKHDDGSSRREQREQKNDRAPLRNNPLKGRVKSKGDGNTAISLANTALGLL